MDIFLAATGSAIAFCGALAGCSALRTFSLPKDLLDHPHRAQLV